MEHKGANFRVLNRVGEQQFDILCRQVNIEKTNYAFIPKKDLEKGLRDDLYVGLVIFIDNEKPRKYLIPSTVWNEPNHLFTDTAIKNPEYGINLNRETIQNLNETYNFSEVIWKSLLTKKNGTYNWEYVLMGVSQTEIDTAVSILHNKKFITDEDGTFISKAMLKYGSDYLIQKLNNHGYLGGILKVTAKFDMHEIAVIFDTNHFSFTEIHKIIKPRLDV